MLIGAWHQLTGFCHQHAYQLSPTAAEVRAQCVAVQEACLGEVATPQELSPTGGAVHLD